MNRRMFKWEGIEEIFKRELKSRNSIGTNLKFTVIPGFTDNLGDHIPKMEPNPDKVRVYPVKSNYEYIIRNAWRKVGGYSDFHGTNGLAIAKLFESWKGSKKTFIVKLY